MTHDTPQGGPEKGTSLLNDALLTLTKLAQLKDADALADALRKDLNLHDRGEIAWEAATDFRRSVIVEADGYGGAWVREIEDLGGCERLVHQEQYHACFDDAVEQAEEWADLKEDEE